MEPNRVEWALGYTINTGNFQSLRLDVKVDGYQKEDEDIAQCSARVYKFAEAQLKAKLVEARQELE